LDKLSWVGRVQDALTQDRFVLYAQPIMDLTTEEIVQHELLIRMKGSDGEIILPGRFLPAAEEFGLVLNVDRWVVEQSALLASAGHKVEFNLSAKSMGLGMVATIADALRATGAPPENLVCEITETAIMSASDAGDAFVRGLGDLGCKIALDDFGIGYGGLAYLKRLPVSYLKIDIQFVADLVTEETSRHVVRAIIDLAHGFGAQTIAEGAENRETVQILKDLGVDFVQGYFIALPGPVEEMIAIPKSTHNG
jgi:EAL domain-containing protein (putative c-di-GMP-specific phosphodiesterase class I)